MDVFKLHQHVVDDYAAYTKSFIRISDERISKTVHQEISEGLLWPEPLLQLNPSFAPGKRIDELVAEGVLHEDCGRIFRIKKNDNDLGRELRLHLHQEQAIRIAAANEPYVLTTGTGSGKSLAYIIPAVDHVLRTGSGTGIKAIVVYPMNALANSQREELDRFLKRGFGEKGPLVTYARYTGQENEQERDKIVQHPPDILLTNYVMLELILTRIEERRLVEHCGNLRFLVLDELHTYRGRQGADVAMLVRRCREAFQSKALTCVGSSATMVSTGDSQEQSEVVAEVVSRLFGENVPVDNVIGETLRRTTIEYDFVDRQVQGELRACVESKTSPNTEYDAFRINSLASWIEETFGLHKEEGTGGLIRQKPQKLKGEGGAAAKLAELTDCPRPQCESAIQQYLRAGSECKHPETEFPLFAFRLHQFITRGDTVWASLEEEDKRTITLRGQQFVPGDRNKILLPLVFCRYCGQPYYRVDRPSHGQQGPVRPREEYSKTISDELESGYLYLSSTHPWPEDPGEWSSRVPDDWIEIRRGNESIKRDKPLPELITLGTNGEIDPNGIRVAFVRASFQFCLNPACRVAYNARQSSDVGKLSTIGVDGRSTATTILALSTILKLRADESLEEEARKLLSFTDNRQDASLQAGHFNDFVEVGLIRSGLYRAMVNRGVEGLRYDALVQDVEKALNLPTDLFANALAELRGPLLEETRRAFRSVIGYYLYRDLERGWRVTSPNLEQCGLLEFEYLGIDDVANDQSTWEEKNAHAALVTATPDQRKNVIRTLLDHLRRSLAIKEDSLNSNYQERISTQSGQRLREPWVIDDPSDMVQGGVAWPRSRMDRERQEDVCISSRSNFGQFLQRHGVLPDMGEPLRLEDKDEIINSLFRCLKLWGLVEEVRSPREGSLIPGYQVPSSVMVWKPGDGSRPMVDPLRIKHESEQAVEGNRYFIDLYKGFADLGPGLEGREHTAQVPSDIRRSREKSFGRAELPILFCSPTMELGVDIAQLNVVNMRNVPPTPANYAQRSGRAGRGGQPALVYTYCSGFSPHDKYYFRQPEQMVAGAVSAPRLDLLNRDLVEAHIHAIWLSEAKLKLGTTLTEILVVTEDDLSLPLKEKPREVLADASAKLRAQQRARRLLDSIGPELEQAPWYRDGWLDDVLTRLPQRFDEACHRWRSLYRAAVQQRRLQNKVIGDHSRPTIDRDRARRLRAQAEAQITLLTNPQNAIEGDFYSYRYFASEGFLPGYNFPRLPLSAFIPARRGRRGKDEFLSRPRFLAISEYGPRAVIYHEGSQYRINKVNLAFDEDSQELTQYVMKVCSGCGYGHLAESDPGVDNCENCGRPLQPTDEIREMVRLQNVTAKRADRITSDEEERQRIGYEIRSTFRFAVVNGEPDFRKAEVNVGDRHVATVRYGDAATIWRINVGWRQRRQGNHQGFLLDVERGYWATNRDVQDGDREDPLNQARIRRVVPYVQDTRNVLTFELEGHQDLRVIATLQAALKQGIQQVFQLEPNELAADPLPSADDRRLIFFYEAAEGGAGVLRQVAEEPNTLAKVARAALKTCHFDPDTGEDEGRAACEAACYDCLLEYGNQPDHRNLDRALVVGLLMDLTQAVTEVSGSRRTRVDHLDDLLRACDSGLERRWLQQVYQSQLRLPSHAQYLISACSTRPDFYYNGVNTAVYIDGPIHDEPDQKVEDEQITQRLIGAGYLVIRFHHADDWNTVFDRYADVFGQRKGV